MEASNMKQRNARKLRNIFLIYTDGNFTAKFLRSTNLRLCIKTLILFDPAIP